MPARYYHQVAAFPTHSALHSRLPDGRLRRQILANAEDEELRGTAHSELWLQFAEAVGANRDEVRAGGPIGGDGRNCRAVPQDRSGGSAGESPGGVLGV